MPGLGEWIVILMIVLVVFGANKLPGIGDALGRSIRNFKRASAGGDDDDADDKEPPKKGSKQIAGKPSKQIDEGKATEGEGEGDDEWEEVVVRRKKKKSTAAEG
jgi:sec-independent protein translocase protein TatA